MTQLLISSSYLSLPFSSVWSHFKVVKYKLGLFSQESSEGGWRKRKNAAMIKQNKRDGERNTECKIFWLLATQACCHIVMIIDLNQKDSLSLCPCYSSCIVSEQTRNRLKSPYSLPGVQSKIVRELPPLNRFYSFIGGHNKLPVACSTSPQSTFRVVHPLPIIVTICINSSLAFHILHLIFNTIVHSTILPKYESIPPQYPHPKIHTFYNIQIFVEQFVNKKKKFAVTNAAEN